MGWDTRLSYLSSHHSRLVGDHVRARKGERAMPGSQCLCTVKGLMEPDVCFQVIIFVLSPTSRSNPEKKPDPLGFPKETSVFPCHNPEQRIETASSHLQGAGGSKLRGTWLFHGHQCSYMCPLPACPPAILLLLGVPKDGPHCAGKLYPHLIGVRPLANLSILAPKDV